MKHTILHGDDLPLLPVLVDRRRNPDRRALWRGGRRDSDWTERPPGAWPRLARGEAGASPTARFRQALSSLHLLW
ncbi:MAG TPA: hypothetical protein VD833_02725 [Vicinamibacterales bacterium]|nr:hypothetical protein [Vicinamibacterales bacterium]